MSNNSNPTFVKSMDLFGKHVKQIPCIVGEGSPTSDTYGAVGCLYMDSSNNGEMYKCVEVSDTSYTWVKLISEDSGENAPYIGDNGNWFVNGEDTGVSATGAGIEDITIKEV